MSHVNIISWGNINNAGDKLIETITINLVSEYVGLETKQINIYPRKEELIKKGLEYAIRFYISVFLLAIGKVFFRDALQYKIKKKAYAIRLKKYFKQEFQDSKGIVYAIGMLKYSTQNVSFLIELINTVALEKNITVIISGASVEKPDDSDWRFHQLKRALNYPNVKIITTRDGQEGIEILNKYYIVRKDIILLAVGDPALLLDKYYTINKVVEGHHVGIGLIRKTIFNNYRGDISEEGLYKIYSELIDIFESNGQDWQLFCNGMDDDYKFGLELIKRNKIPASFLASKPKDPEELISIINRYDIIVAARLHSSIIATALDKPVTGFYWDDKVRCFARETQKEQFYLEMDQFNAANIYSNYLILDETAEQNRIQLNSLRDATLESFELIGRILKK